MSERLAINDRSECRQRDGLRQLPNPRCAAGFVFSGLCYTALLNSLLGSALAANTDEPAAADQAAAASAGDLTPALLLDDLESGAREKQARLVRLRMQLQRLTEESRRIREQSAPAEPE